MAARDSNNEPSLVDFQDENVESFELEAEPGLNPRHFHVGYRLPSQARSLSAYQMHALIHLIIKRMDIGAIIPVLGILVCHSVEMRYFDNLAFLYVCSLCPKMGKSTA